MGSAEGEIYRGGKGARREIIIRRKMKLFVSPISRNGYGLDMRVRSLEECRLVDRGMSED